MKISVTVKWEANGQNFQKTAQADGGFFPVHAPC
jgi:hypothetical protein